MTTELRQKHDELLGSGKPDSLSDEEYASLIEDHKRNCSFCNEEKAIEDDDPDERGDMEKTYSQAELEKAVADAVAPIQDKLDELRNSQAAEEIQAQIEQAQEEATAAVQAAKAETDTAVAEKAALEQELADLNAFLEAEKTRAEEQAALEERKAERRKAVEELAVFDADRIDARLEDWASMDDDTWASQLEDWATIAPKKTDKSDAELETAVDGTRKPKGKSGTSLTSVVRSGVNLNTL